MSAQPLEWQALWDAMESSPNQWIPTTENMYWEMLGALPPRKMLGDNLDRKSTRLNSSHT